MDRPRFGEKVPSLDRRQRYFKKGDLWYCNTREGQSIGPYDRLTDAIFGCGGYIKQLQHAPILVPFSFPLTDND